MQMSFVIGVSARYSPQHSTWFADVFTLERQPDARAGHMGGRLRADNVLAPTLLELFAKHGAGWYEVDTASVMMGQTEVKNAVTMSWVEKQPANPLVRSLGSSGRTPAGDGK